MRTSYIAPSTPRASPHRYYTRNNQNPISPSDTLHQPRDNTPPTFLDKSRNLFQYRGDSESSDEEPDIQAGQLPERKSRLRSAANLFRNLFLWIGLSFLTLNVYILSQLKKVWLWKDPFLDTGLNKEPPDSPERSYRTNKLDNSLTDKQTDKQIEPDAWTDTDGSTDLDSSIDFTDRDAASVWSNIAETLIYHPSRKLSSFIYDCLKSISSCVKTGIRIMVIACKSILNKTGGLLRELGSVLFLSLCKILNVLTLPFVWMWRTISVWVLKGRIGKTSSEISEISMGDVAGGRTEYHNNDNSLGAQTDGKTDEQINGQTNGQTCPTANLASEENESFDSEATGLSRAPMGTKLGSFTSNSRPASNTVPPQSEVGWCGFLGALLFLAGLVLLLGVLLVPSPIQGNGESSTISVQIFSFLEEQKQVAAKVSELEAGLLSLDEKTLKSHSELQSAIKGLEEKKDKLESELVAIATLDRQQSQLLEQLQSQHTSQNSRVEALSSKVNGAKLDFDNLKTQIELLRQSTGTLSDLQSKLAASQSTDRDTISEKMAELGTSYQSIVEQNTELVRKLGGLEGDQTEMAALVQSLSRKHDELTVSYQKLSEAAEAGVPSSDLERLRDETLSLITEVKVDEVTRQKLEDQGVLMKEYQDKLLDLEKKLSSIPTQQPETLPPNLLPRLDSLHKEIEVLRSTSISSQQYTTLERKVDGIRGELEGYVSSSGDKIKEVWSALQEYQLKVTEDNKLSLLKLQSVESKLAVLTALQNRLEKLELVQNKGEEENKHLQEEISRLVASLKDLDVKYNEKVRALELSLSSLKSVQDSEASRTSETVKQHAEELKTMKSKLSTDVTSLQQKLVDLESSTTNKIRSVVLEVLSSVTHSSPDTRFFGDWLRANFLTREQFDREVHNETVSLPSQDQLVQIVISELHSKHSIDLNPASGITTADIRVIVNEALQTFDEDKTGRADFALEALGGNVISIGCTETYYEGAPYASFMSVPLFRLPNPPNVALQPDITPGKCWAFKGNKGYMMIKLAHAVVIDGFSMEHLPRKLSLNNDISSAPNKFTVRGISHPEDSNSHYFGEFRYSDTGTSLQHFNVAQRSSVAYEIVEVDIESNHGNSEYTCLYRIRVHGKVPKLS
ncbi:hypothetical protein ACHWQZ_G014142 [Mnemiopsis leidyi]